VSGELGRMWKKAAVTYSKEFSCLEGMKLTTKNLSQNCRHLGRDFDPGLPKHETGVLPTQAWRVVQRCYTYSVRSYFFTLSDLFPLTALFIPRVVADLRNFNEDTFVSGRTPVELGHSKIVKARRAFCAPASVCEIITGGDHPMGTGGKAARTWSWPLTSF